MRRLRLLVASLPALLTALAGSVPQAHANPSHADVPGIAWFEGGVAEAFEAARAANKPVFLYWGAKWCPPCQQLKSSVFSRADFMAKSKEFVAVYLDGDDPGAQKWGERFHVSGYPTVVILRPDQKEIMRIAGGMDLASYADLLDIALSDLKPMSEVLAALRSDAVPLGHEDCQRLAYYAWDLADTAAAERKPIADDLARAAATCTTLTPAERARLSVSSVTLQITPDGVTRLIGIVEDPVLAPKVADALQDLREEFFKAVKERGPAVGAAFVAAWTRTMDSVAADPKVIDADQLSAIGSELTVLKQFSPQLEVPEDAAAAARARVSAVLAKKLDPYVRAGIVNSASDIYEQLGDTDAEYAMLKGELSTARSPYYYMADLGELEEKRGHREAALAWFERAYVESQGAATRFQWGTMYVSALLRLAPADHVRIRKAGLKVIAELDGPDRIQARTRASLVKLEDRLHKWDADHRYDADLKALQGRLAGVCGKLPQSDSGYDSCRKFLS
jgi:thiol-disulfide isomerase/thioredoxin